MNQEGQPVLARGGCWLLWGAILVIYACPLFVSSWSWLGARMNQGSQPETCKRVFAPGSREDGI